RGEGEAGHARAGAGPADGPEDDLTRRHACRKPVHELLSGKGVEDLLRRNNRSPGLAATAATSLLLATEVDLADRLLVRADVEQDDLGVLGDLLVLAGLAVHLDFRVVGDDHRRLLLLRPAVLLAGQE